MILFLSPIRMDATLAVSRTGDVLTINGTMLDFGPLPPGGVLPREAIGNEWIAGDVTRDMGGTLTVPVLLPHGPIPWPPPPEAAVVTHPAPLVLTGDGPVTLPAYTVPEGVPLMPAEDGE